MAANYTSLCLEHSEHLCDFAGTWGSSINRIQVLKSQLQEGKDTIFFLWTVITRSPTSHLNPVFLCVAPLPTCSETQNQTWTSRLLVRKVRTSRCLRRMPSAGLTSTHLTRDPEARPPAERWEWPSWVFTIVLRKWSFFYIKMMTNINISLKKKKDKFPELIWCFFFFSSDNQVLLSVWRCIYRNQETCMASALSFLCATFLPWPFFFGLCFCWHLIKKLQHTQKRMLWLSLK